MNGEKIDRNKIYDLEGARAVFVADGITNPEYSRIVCYDEMRDQVIVTITSKANLRISGNRLKFDSLGGDKVFSFLGRRGSRLFNYVESRLNIPERTI